MSQVRVCGGEEEGVLRFPHTALTIDIWFAHLHFRSSVLSVSITNIFYGEKNGTLALKKTILLRHLL